jgi:hypothetical protein
VTWKSKKAFLYFGGAFVILLGGVIILVAPYHYFWFVIRPGETRPFSIWEGSGYYPQLEFTFSVTPQNVSEVHAEIRIRDNVSDYAHLFNFTLTGSDAVGPITARQLRRSYVLDLEVDAYLLTVNELVGADYIEIELTQSSDSRLFIVTGGSMNIIGFFMGIAGYFVPGSFLPTGDEIIVDWGFEEKAAEREREEQVTGYEPNPTK